jgi:hypothetical protein
LLLDEEKIAHSFLPDFGRHVGSRLKKSNPGRMNFKRNALQFASVAWLAFAAAAYSAQPVVPPQAIQQFQDVIGSRVEAVTILGGDYGAAGGIYTFRGGEIANLSIAKIGGGGNIAEPRPLGESGMKWAPVVQGNLGHLSAQNEFANGYLVGNKSVYDVLAVQGAVAPGFISMTT